MAEPQATLALGENLPVHVLGGAGAIDDPDALRILPGDGEEAGANALVKGHFLAFETVGGRAAAAAAGTREADLDRAVENEREIRKDALAGRGLDRPHRLERKLTPIGL